MVWGILAMLMRFVPFIGSYIAALPKGPNDRSSSVGFRCAKDG